MTIPLPDVVYFPFTQITMWFGLLGSLLVELTVNVVPPATVKPLLIITKVGAVGSVLVAVTDVTVLLFESLGNELPPDRVVVMPGPQLAFTTGRVFVQVQPAFPGLTTGSNVPGRVGLNGVEMFPDTVVWFAPFTAGPL